jgi:hypothetical protein
LVLLFHEDIMKIYFIAGAIITIPLALGFHPLAGLENYDSRDLTGVWKGSSSNKRYEVSMVFKKAGGYEQYLYYSNGATSADEKNSCVWSGFGNYRVERNVIIIQITRSSDNVPVNISFRLLKYSLQEMTLQDAASGKISIMRLQR